jgi:hypothetical protein
MASDALDVETVCKVVFLVDGVLAELTLLPACGTALREHQKDPSRVDCGEAIGFFGNVEYYYVVFCGDRALV